MTQTRQLFGTDGIRGVAGEFPLTRDSVYWIGRALGHDLVRAKAKPRVVIGQDTRASSDGLPIDFCKGWVGGSGGEQRGSDYDSGGCVSGALAGIRCRGGNFGFA